MGSFGRHSQFDTYADKDSVAIKLVRPGEDRREAVIHLHYGLLAEILTELARSLTLRDPLDDEHRPELQRSGKAACRIGPPSPTHRPHSRSAERRGLVACNRENSLLERLAGRARRLRTPVPL